MAKTIQELKESDYPCDTCRKEHINIVICRSCVEEIDIPLDYYWYCSEYEEMTDEDWKKLENELEYWKKLEKELEDA